MDTPSKSILKSRTFWVNAATFAVAFLGLLQGQAWIMANPTLVTLIVMAIAALNAYLRTDTKDPVHFVGK